MKKIIFLILLTTIPSIAYAGRYLVEKPDGSVTVVEYVEGSKDSLSDVLDSFGLQGLPIDALNPGDLPATRIDRKYWKKNPVPIGSKVIIDTVKKNADLALEAKKQAEKDAVLLKLKISEDELKALLK